MLTNYDQLPVLDFSCTRRIYIVKVEHDSLSKYTITLKENKIDVIYKFTTPELYGWIELVITQFNRGIKMLPSWAEIGTINNRPYIELEL